MERIDGRSETFRVAAMETVRWDEFGVPDPGETALLALTTCFPFDTD